MYEKCKVNAALEVFLGFFVCLLVFLSFHLRAMYGHSTELPERI